MVTTSWTPKQDPSWGAIDTPWGSEVDGLWGAKTQKGPDIVSADQARFGGFVGNTAVMFLGRRGNGKTLAQTMLADQDIRRFTATGYPGHVFSNYAMSFLRSLTDDGQVISTFDAARSNIDATPIDIYDPNIVERVSEFPNYFRRGTFRGDEVQTMAMGRRSMARSNVNLSQFLIQMRHRDIDASFTTQFPQIIDYQVLLQIDLFIKVRIVKRYSAPSYFPAIMIADIWDWWGQITGKDWRKTWPPAREDIDKTVKIYVPLRMMGTYSTKQIISSVYWDRETRDRVNMLEEATIDRSVDMPMDEDEQNRDERMHEEMAKAQDEYQVNPGIRFNGDAIDWAKKQAKVVTLDQDKLKIAQSLELPVKSLSDLENLFEAVGYTINPRHVGGARWKEAVKE